MQPFERFVDVAQVKTILQQELPGFREGRLLIHDCTIVHAHYYTSAKHAHKARLSVCYQLRGVDRLQQTEWTQLIYGRARLGGVSQSEFVEAQNALLATPPIGPALVHLPDHDLTLWGFPNDPRMPHLPAVVDATLIKPYLPKQALPAGWSEIPTTQQVAIEVIHYYPEVRCTLRYHLYGGPPDQTHTTRLIGKTFADESGEQIYQRLQEAWQQSIIQAGSFRVAQPLGYVPAIHTIWMRHEVGTPLLRMINATNAESLLAAVARGLVALQRCEFPGLTVITIDEQMQELGNKVQKLCEALPQLSKMLQHLYAQLDERANHNLQPNTSLVHGDFHIRQLLVDQGEIIFLDFDEFAEGDPLQDVANFIVDLYYEGLPITWVGEMAQHFVREYRAVADWSVPYERLQWHIRFQFITRAYRFYRQHRRNLCAEVQQALAFAEVAINGF